MGWDAAGIEDLKLMIPGPVPVTDEVLAEMARPVVCHYGEEWTAFYNDTLDAARRVLGVAGDLFITVGSGHAGLDAAALAAAEPGERVLVLDNGVFGQRLAEICASWGLDVLVERWPWGRAVDPEGVASALRRHPEVRAVFMVHGETSTGVLNPAREVARVVREADRLFVLDAVSSAGIAPLQVDAWGIDVCVTASQKGLGAPPGLVLVAAGERLWQRVRARRRPIPGWYTNLARWKEFAIRQAAFQPYFITMAVNNVRALRRALALIEQEGLAARWQRHALVARRLRAGLRALGLAPEADDERALPGVTVFRTPPGITAPALRDRLRDEHGILVSTGLGAWRETHLRIGHMAAGATEAAVDEALAALRGALGVAA